MLGMEFLKSSWQDSSNLSRRDYLNQSEQDSSILSNFHLRISRHNSRQISKNELHGNGFLGIIFPEPCSQESFKVRFLESLGMGFRKSVTI